MRVYTQNGYFQDLRQPSVFEQFLTLGIPIYLAVESGLGEINCTLDNTKVYPLEIGSFDRISGLEGHVSQLWHR